MRGAASRMIRRQRRHEKKMLGDMTMALTAIRLLPFRRRLTACWLILFGRVTKKGT